VLLPATEAEGPEGLMRKAGKQEKTAARHAAKNGATANGPSLSGEVLVAVLERGEKKWTLMSEFRSGAGSEISVHWRSFAVPFSEGKSG